MNAGGRLDERDRRSARRTAGLATRAEVDTGLDTVVGLCYNGKIEYSVTVDGGTFRLYVMETDQEIIFDDADGLMSWLRSNRAEAAQESEAGKPRKSIFRKVTQWE